MELELTSDERKAELINTALDQLPIQQNYELCSQLFSMHGYVCTEEERRDRRREAGKAKTEMDG